MVSRLSWLLLPALAFLLGTVLAQRFPTSSVVASPADVRGSDNVLVTGYRNRAGTFLLWSSGRITRPDGTQANAAGAYVAAPGFSRPERVQNQTVGSANVACGAAPGAAGTVVLFSDGTARLPDNVEAAAASPDARVVWGFVDPGPDYGQGSGDWSISVNGNGTFHVAFNPRFETRPAVVTGGSSGAYRLSNVNNEGFDLFDQEGNAPDRKVPFTFVASGS